MAHLVEVGMAMARVKGIPERNLSQLNLLTCVIYAEILQIIGSGTLMTGDLSAQTLEKVVRSTVLLKNDHDVPKVGNLGLDKDWPGRRHG